MQTQISRKSLSQIMYMCLGFFGIQFGWALQMSNMSTIYARLGAKEDQIPLLWLAATKFTFSERFSGGAAAPSRISSPAGDDLGALPLKTPPKGTQSPLETQGL